VAVGGQTSLLRRLSRSVIGSVGAGGAEFARNADSERVPPMQALRSAADR